ncbi:hydrolase 1, exosortase A system-associated [Massilia sp. LXY-6]|uniref:hydrolase 1, exosortase A system-associated n=1 Tax=Massilia sp. LXY-6 TaxID=3379823 RepID=UPI003EDEDDD9
MRFEDKALAFSCAGDWLYGVVSVPEQPARRGVLIVVGGPQYRAGSHRQFVLLARQLAAAGVPAMRFDYRGMGDSEGDPRDFTSIGDDLQAALDQFFAAVPGMAEVALWGLCDGASAPLCQASLDRRVTGLVLLNPWVRTEHGIAKTTLKHYYRSRLLEPELWRKILQGQFDYVRAAKSFVALVSSAFRSGRSRPAASDAPISLPLPERMGAGLASFRGKVLLIVSGADLTGQEFLDMAAASPSWRRLLETPRVTRHDLPGADHTCSRRAWRDQVALWTSDWVRSW